MEHGAVLDGKPWNSVTQADVQLVYNQVAQIELVCSPLRIRMSVLRRFMPYSMYSMVLDSLTLSVLGVLALLTH